MDTERIKRASQWYYSTVFRDEVIRPSAVPVTERLPSLLRTARSLENTSDRVWQSRESVFLKQAKLLANYEDDYVFNRKVVRYYPTYQALTDGELRGYFSWRTKLRKGNIELTSLSFAFLYIYELLNQIGVRDPMDGYEKLCVFRDVYGVLDGNILPYLERWLTDYVVYYELDAQLLSNSKQVLFDKSIMVLDTIHKQDASNIIAAVKTLAPKWLSRSKFYNTHSEDCDKMIVRTLCRVSDHYSKHTKKTMVTHFFGKCNQYPLRLFDTAVFCDPLKKRSCEYIADPICSYHCENGLWSVTKYTLFPHAGTKLENLLKTIDALMRNAYGYKHPIKQELDIKWLVKIIAEKIEELQREKKATEAKKITIDYTKLNKIRHEAALTQEKLTVEEDMEEVPVREPVPIQQEEICPLTGTEYRLLQCLLYDRPTDWILREGHILSVLLDSINDKLYDIFQDTVLTDTPEVLEDYFEELKEMVEP